MLDTIVDILLALPRWLYSVLADWAVQGVQNLAPDTFGDMSSYVVAMYDIAGWLLTMSEFAFGFNVIISAVIARFIFSMIPLVGR